MNRITAWSVGLTVLLIVVLAVCLTKVRLNEVGVKVNMIGGGIVKDDLEPGYYFLVPGMQKMYRLDPTVQAFAMGGSDAGVPALVLRDKDEYNTRFDITILYRIKPGEAHRLAEQVGMQQDQILNFLKSESRDALQNALGQYKTEAFYNVEKREVGRQTAKDQLSQRLALRNLELVDLLIRDIEYDPKYEQILVQKQLLGQNKALAVEKARLEAELEKTQAIEYETTAKVKVIGEELTQEVANIEAETDARVKEIEADADLTSQKLLAEADKYRRTKMSEGELAKTQAKAKGEKAINEAYLGLGGQAYITRQMIDSIEFGDIEINTNQVNPFDVDQLLRMFGLDAEALEKAAAGKVPGGG